ncbi:hypothetical protein [Brytella acorum]|uniref:Uncharacterized protein n=1 Tax=Brytella acorum TaxID=2959299 RepID=A0AA35UIF4_9PROT|nr:hypothetical protein [Brytella acorum]CAI9120845.1 hypothetical protein LMG32879_001684 [Brytella acorum]
MRKLVGSTLMGVMVVAGIAHVPCAHARSISDAEAGRLTLDALTAEPVYHRPVTMHHVMARHSGSHSSRASLVHAVVYHPKASFRHHSTRHRG